MVPAGGPYSWHPLLLDRRGSSPASQGVFLLLYRWAASLEISYDCNSRPIVAHGLTVLAFKLVAYRGEPHRHMTLVADGSWERCWRWEAWPIQVYGPVSCSW